MEKPKMNAIVDSLQFLVFLSAIGSALILNYIIPFGSGPTSFLSVARGDWRTLHTTSGLVFGMIILVHIALHFDWIKNLPKFLLGK
jgi:hypothetical protein